MVTHAVSNVDFTYNFCMNRFSILDRFFIPNYIFDTCVQSVAVSHEIDNCSDHDPLYLQLNVSWTSLSHSTVKAGTKKPAWWKAKDTDLNNYKMQMQCNLREILVPTSTLACQDVKCSDRNHHRLLQEYANSICKVIRILLQKPMMVSVTALHILAS